MTVGEEHGTPEQSTPPPSPPSSRGELEPPSLAGGAPSLERTLSSIERLRATVSGAADQVVLFQRAVDTRLDLLAAYTVTVTQALDDMQHRLSHTETQVTELATRLAASDDQGARLMALYAATQQLHATLDPVSVKRAIADIVENLLGAASYALLEWGHRPPELAVAHARGSLPTELVLDGKYAGGDALVDAAIADGQVRTGAGGGSHALAVVPLHLLDAKVGVLVITELLGHKVAFDDRDCEMLEVLASHAASALYLAELHATSDRRLRTLEDLVALVRHR